MRQKQRSKETWQEQKKAEALSLMKALEAKIKKGELVVVMSGWWTNDGHTTFKLDLTDSSNPTFSEQS
jgi:hypothetical protein